MRYQPLAPLILLKKFQFECISSHCAVPVHPGARYSETTSPASQNKRRKLEGISVPTGRVGISKQNRIQAWRRTRIGNWQPDRKHKKHAS